jgi:hypothetical protein
MEKKRKVGKALYWTPRIISIIFILFLAMFSLDVFGNGYTFWETVVALLMHNIPVFVLLILLLISWKKEIVGAYTFFIAGLIYIGFMVYNAISTGGEWYWLSYSLIIAGPAFFIGYLFYLNWKRKKN